MIRKSVLVDNDIKYEEFFSPAEDYRLWARLMDVTHFYNIQQVLVKYRTHNNMTSLQQEQKMNLAWRAISTQLRNQYPAYYNALKMPTCKCYVFQTAFVWNYSNIKN